MVIPKIPKYRAYALYRLMYFFDKFWFMADDYPIGFEFLIKTTKLTWLTRNFKTGKIKFFC